MRRTEKEWEVEGGRGEREFDTLPHCYPGAEW